MQWALRELSSTEAACPLMCSLRLTLQNAVQVSWSMQVSLSGNTNTLEVSESHFVHCVVVIMYSTFNSVVKGAGLILACLVISGCGNGEEQAKIDFAKSTVQRSLESWKLGSQPADLQTGSEPVEFYDDDWERSAKLLDFEIRQTYIEPSDGTARCEVLLTVKYPKQEAIKVRCAYQVVTDPNVKVARDPMA
jgi:hypothetical protein